MPEAANAPGTAPALPLFYTAPRPIDPQRHVDWKIKQRRSFAYAAKTNAVPILMEEFPVLESHYPLVFTLGDNPAVVALLGLRPNENLFVDAAGGWVAGAPIPAYVRRYPFILVETPDRSRLVLCLEEDNSVVGPDGDFPLFDGDQAGQGGKDALQFCGTFNQSAQATQAFCQELKSRGLLTEQRAELTTPDGRRLALSGFAVIDEKKFNELPDDVFVEWRKRNWIGLIYTHLLSLGRWGRLAEMSAKQDGQAAA